MGAAEHRLTSRAAAHLAQQIGELLIERELSVIECNPVLVATEARRRASARLGAGLSAEASGRLVEIT